MGLHQDRDEREFAAPVLSVSLGDACLFRYGGVKRTDPTRSIRLASGDALVLGGPSRLCFHGVDRIDAGSGDLLPNPGRINLTLRRVTLSGLTIGCWACFRCADAARIGNRDSIPFRSARVRNVKAGAADAPDAFTVHRGSRLWTVRKADNLLKGAALYPSTRHE